MTTAPTSQDPDPITTAEAVLYLRVSTKEQAERGGEIEGFSIPAQREAGLRKAQAIGATVTAEFVDAGESARSADRPELQHMLAHLTAHPEVRYVIVHKIDRLARNRVDDVEINLAITKAGAQLVSCTENIDETPSGMLMHGIMSSIAEFYSRNLANEVIKGTQQKVLAGGTPTLAPVGYLNVRKMVEGREVRTVDIDPERAHHVAWAFETYASGDWSQRRLAEALELRGLTQRPTAKRSARPLPPNKVAELLHNPYYTGIVTWRGVQFEGKHPRLVTPETYAQVQAVLEAHRHSGERSYRRRHYLAGSLFCADCGAKLIYSVSTGRRGDKYDYWLCIAKHTYKTGCQAPNLPAPSVEDAVANMWLDERLSEAQATMIRDNLLADLDAFNKETATLTSTLARRIEAVQRERRKWAEKAIEGLVPDDIAREKQAELARQLATAEAKRAQLGHTNTEHETVIHKATDLLPHCGQAYQVASDSVRRDYNQAWFKHIFVGEVDGRATVAHVERTDLFQALMTAEIVPDATADFQNWDLNTKRPGSVPSRVISHVGGLKVESLVELRGLEPLTPSMPWRCATSCATAPRDMRIPADESGGPEKFSQPATHGEIRPPERIVCRAAAPSHRAFDPRIRRRIGVVGSAVWVVRENDGFGEGLGVVVDDLPAVTPAELEHRPGTVRHPRQDLAKSVRHPQEREQTSPQRRSVPDYHAGLPHRDHRGGIVQNPHHPCAHLLGRLGAGHPRLGARHEAREGLRVLRLELREGQPLAHPHVVLPQSRIEHEIDGRKKTNQRLSRRAGARQVARPHERRVVRREERCRTGRLRAADLVQRDVRVALGAADRVPLGAAVAPEHQPPGASLAGRPDVARDHRPASPPPYEPRAVPPAVALSAPADPPP
jgi:site-specific DNA recombinase